MSPATSPRGFAAAVALALAALALSPALPAAPADAAAEHRYVLTGALGTPVPFQPVRGVAVDGAMRFDLGLPQGAVAHVDATSRSGTVHLYRAPGEGSAPLSVLPLYMLGDPVPAARKALTLDGSGSFVVDPGPGAFYRIEVTIRGFWGDVETGSPAPVTVNAMQPWGCPITVRLLCPP